MSWGTEAPESLLVAADPAELQLRVEGRSTPELGLWGIALAIVGCLTPLLGHGSLLFLLIGFALVALGIAGMFSPSGDAYVSDVAVRATGFAITRDGTTTQVAPNRLLRADVTFDGNGAVVLMLSLRAPGETLVIHASEHSRVDVVWLANLFEQVAAAGGTEHEERALRKEAARLAAGRSRKGSSH